MNCCTGNMTTIFIIAAAALIVFQFLLVVWFVLGTRRNFPTTSGRLSAAVVLCCRGADPSLPRCLESIDAQTQRDLKCVLVTDSESDPAVEALIRHRAKNPQSCIQHRVAQIDNDRCSLKCNSLVYASDEYLEHAEVLMLIDSDVVPPSNWAGQMVGAIDSTGAAAVFGAPWFEPQRGSIGSWVRHVWNAAAMVQMHVYRVAWGGSLAIRSDAFRTSNLESAWSKSLFEDVLLYDYFRDRGLSVVPVSGLFLTCNERCSVYSARQWITRQLFDMRLYHSKWLAVLGHALLSAVIPWGLIVLAIVGVARGDATAGLRALIGFLALQLSNAGLLLWIRSRVHECGLTGQDRGDFPQSTIALAARYCVLVPLVQVLHFWASIRVCFQRRVTWRAIDYVIHRPFDVRRLFYNPFVPHRDQTAAGSSVD